MPALNYFLLSLLIPSSAWGQKQNESLQDCGDARYYPSHYTCYDTNFLCPIEAGQPMLKCGSDCYLPTMYSCVNGSLIYPPSNSSMKNCPTEARKLHLSSPPYENYFYSDCNSATQVVVTSPLLGSDMTVISPRIIVAWPAGNSGLVIYFQPESGVNGTLGIQLLNSTSGDPLGPVFDESTGGNATVGITTQVSFNTSAVLSVTILGSIRTIRDFTEGPSLLRSEIQDAVKYTSTSNGVEISRLWLDNITTTSMSFTSTKNQTIQLKNDILTFEAGTYTFNASFNYPQLTQLTSQEVLSPESANLITQYPTQAESLSFLSYTSKLTAGAWRFLTYFGRDSMISALLLEPVLSTGKGGTIEAVIAEVLERINSTDGSVCHEETIGDYATWTHLQNNVTSTAPLCDYKMIDSDYYLPILMDRYFLQNPTGASRASDFLSTKASIFPQNVNLSYQELASINANKIVTLASPFAAPGNQTKDNLMHLKDGEIVGQWRDSTYGIGGGRIPFDVNTALVPAALRSIASLSRGGILDLNATLIDSHAQIWEDSTLSFFEINIPLQEAQSRLENYVNSSGITGLPSQSSTLTTNITFHALALDGDTNLSRIAVMNTDSCFRHFLLNTTDQSQLTSLLNATATSILLRFPAGLMTDVGLLIANPAYGGHPIYARNWTTSAYHGTVVWSWQLAMMAKGLAVQLSRCDSSADVPDFCTTNTVLENVKNAYRILWDSIERNEQYLGTEVWSWVYRDGTFGFVDLGSITTPVGTSPTESDVVQLWSLTFLAVRREEGLRYGRVGG